DATQLTGNLPALNGSSLTNLNASNLASGTLPDARLSGTYTSALTLNNASNAFTGDGSALTNISGANVSNVIKLQNTLQSGATFYVSSGTVAGPFVVTGQITAGSGNKRIKKATGLHDATQLSGNLTALDGSALTNLTGGNVVGNIPGNAANITGNLAAAQI